MDLPVRRPRERARSLVLAFPEELDAWVRSRFESKGESEIDGLRRKVNTLEKQNKMLRTKLASARGAATEANAIAAELEDRCYRAVRRNVELRLQTAELVELSRNLQFLRACARPFASLGLEEAISQSEFEEAPAKPVLE